MVSHVLLLIIIKKNPIVEKLISKVVSLHLEEKGLYELKQNLNLLSFLQLCHYSRQDISNFCYERLRDKIKGEVRHTASGQYVFLTKTVLSFKVQ